MADEKSFNLPQEEEKILEFWKKNKIFEKSLALRQGADLRGTKRGFTRKKTASMHKPKTFVFFEGPPYANGKPGVHHVLARIYKDIILRYKSMRGYYVPRRAGWDTHGLPVEIAAEKALGLKSKKDIEKFGIERFNEEARKAVWIYKDEWENLTERIGYWLDLKNAYVTCSSEYVETLWWVLARIWKRGLLYKAHKVVPWCPRCGTALSSHELAQGYKEVEDQSVYVKFKLKKGQVIGHWTTGDNSYILSWTTTPWTLPGNVALAVGKKIQYVSTEKGGDELWYAKNSSLAKELGHTDKEVYGSYLVGLQYEPLFNIPKLKNEKSHRIYAADFVTTKDGTGVVHTAVMYGEDDYELGKKVGLPQHHTVGEDGRFMKEVKGGLAGLKVKDKETEEKIFEELKKKNFLLKTELYKHEYPFCWRCGSAVIYYARTSWFIAMSKLRKNLLKSNKTINWVPEHVKEGRFGEWLKEAKDWNLSRERYWGSPMPVWECAKCNNMEVIQGLDDLKKKAVQRNEFFFLRHGEAEHNIKKLCAPSKDDKKRTSHLTAKGKEDIKKIVEIISKKKINVIISSPLARARETAKIVQPFTKANIIYNERIVDIDPGVSAWKPESQYNAYVKNELQKFDTPQSPKGESFNDVKQRMTKAFSEINEKYKNKRILIVGHGHPLWLLKGALEGMSNEEILKAEYPENGKLYEIDTRTLPLDGSGNLDLHRPYVDAVILNCSKCGNEMKRIKEVADVWFDSGAMPFAQVHYPFEPGPRTHADLTRTNAEKIQRISAFGLRPSVSLEYPADYICEAMDQTRGWFYTLLSVATALGYKAPYKNVISLGLINDKFGQKMSKSKGNIVDPWKVISDYGVDALRWYFYTATPPGEPKNFDEREIAKAYRKFHLIFWNSIMFYKTYADKRGLNADQRGKSQRKSALSPRESASVLDKWILARLNETISQVDGNLEHYYVREAALAIESLLDDLSRWYIRRSRRRFSVAFKGATKNDLKDYESASRTLGFVLAELNKLIAPFTPFFAEAVYKELKAHNSRQRRGSPKAAKLANLDSVHLADWPTIGKAQIANSKSLIKEMAEIRKISSLALAKRAEIGIKVRQPLAELKVKNLRPRRISLGLKKSKINKELLEILKDEVNVKKIVFSPNIPNDIELDTVITPAFKEEGIIRDFVRAIQELRQEAGLKPGQDMELVLVLPEELKTIVSRNEKFLKSEVSAKIINYKKSEKFGAESETKIDGVPVWIGIKRIR